MRGFYHSVSRHAIGTPSCTFLGCAFLVVEEKWTRAWKNKDQRRKQQTGVLPTPVPVLHPTLRSFQILILSVPPHPGQSGGCR